MSRGRSKRVTLLVVGGVVVATAVIVVGVVYRGSVDAERARVVRGQSVAENRWEGQAVSSLRSIIRSTVQSLDEPIAQAQATYDSTAGRASEDARDGLKNAIAAAKTAPHNALARIDLLADPADLSTASHGNMALTARLKGDLAAAENVAHERAAAFDATEAKRKADAVAAAKKAVPGPKPNGGPHTGPPTSRAAASATSVCLGGGTGYDGAIACVKAMAFGVSATIEWDDKPGSGWWGYTWWNTNGLTARVQLSRSIGTDFGSSPQAISVAMHESGHAANARCPAVATDPVFNQRSSRDKREERFATAYAIAYGAPSRDAAGQSAYDFVSTDEEIAAAKRC